MSTVTITNTQWNQLNVQVRTGNNPIAENNTTVAHDGPMTPFQPYSFTFDVLLFYRRDKNPDAPDGTYSKWITCFSDDTITNP